MKHKTIIKSKKALSPQDSISIVLTIVFSLLSLGLGLIIAIWGNGNSFVETDLITAIITLFGFGLTATVFVYQAFEKSISDNVINVIKALSKTLLLTLCLIIASVIFDFLVTLIKAEVWSVILESLKYATLIYALICQFDILNSFIVIITKGKSGDIND
jgi:hypothetical protein